MNLCLRFGSVTPSSPLFSLLEAMPFWQEEYRYRYSNCIAVFGMVPYGMPPQAQPATIWLLGFDEGSWWVRFRVSSEPLSHTGIISNHLTPFPTNLTQRQITGTGIIENPAPLEYRSTARPANTQTTKAPPHQPPLCSFFSSQTRNSTGQGQLEHRREKKGLGETSQILALFSFWRVFSLLRDHCAGIIKFWWCGTVRLLSGVGFHARCFRYHH